MATQHRHFRVARKPSWIGSGLVGLLLLGPSCGTTADLGPPAVVVTGPASFGHHEAVCADLLRPICVENVSGESLTLVDVGLEGDGAFAVEHAPGLPATLAYGAVACVDVRYRSDGPGLHQATLSLMLRELGRPISVPLTATDAAEWRVEDVFEKPRPEVDVLFVLDVHPAAVNAVVEENLRAFVLEAHQSFDRDDFRVMMTTVDLDRTGALLPEEGSAPVFIEPRRAEDAEAWLDEVLDFRRDDETANLGLASMALALHRAQPHLRPEAHLSVIAISASDDRSPALVEDYTEALHGVRGPRRPDRVSFQAVVTQEEGCGEDPILEHAPRYIEMANRSGGVLASICSFSWWDDLVRGGSGGGFCRSDRLPLTHGAAPGSLEVVVELEGGETYALDTLWE